MELYSAERSFVTSFEKHVSQLYHRQSYARDAPKFHPCGPCKAQQTQATMASITLGLTSSPDSNTPVTFNTALSNNCRCWPIVLSIPLPTTIIVKSAPATNRVTPLSSMVHSFTSSREWPGSSRRGGWTGWPRPARSSSRGPRSGGSRLRRH